MDFFKQFRREAIRLVLISGMTIALVLGWSSMVQGQIPSFLGDASSNTFSPPSNVSRQGEYEIAPVKSPLDHQILFVLTSPTVLHRDNIPEGQIPVEIRAEAVNQRLWRVLSRASAAKTTPKVEIATLNNRLILQIDDDQTSRPIRVVTITEPDSDYQGETMEVLAQEWQTILQGEIQKFKQLTSPKVLLKRIVEALQILIGLIFASVVIWFLRRLLTRRQKNLEARYQQELATEKASQNIEQIPDQEEPSSLTTAVDQLEPLDREETEARTLVDLREQFIATMQRQFSVKRRLDVDKFLKWLLFWAFVMMWYIGAYLIMSRIPVLMGWSRFVLTSPLELVLIWFMLSLVLRISKSWIDRITQSWQASPYLSLGDTQRVALRASTIASSLKGLVTVVLAILGIIWTLNLFSIPTSSILAGGAVLGLAISFGSQSLIKDLVNGCLILIEDQFAVGDVIQIDDKSGFVENLNLRVTQLRNGEGQLITIPNSTITNVRNLTRFWSRVDFSVWVAYENDPNHVLDALRQVTKQLYSEPEWRERLLEKPQVLGIDDLSHEGMLVRVWIKTVPMEQWSVGREFRLRVRQAFKTHQIQIGKPQRVSYNTELHLGDPEESVLHN